MLSIIHPYHVGITRYKLMTRPYVWWFGMNDNIVMKVRTCKLYQQVHNRGHEISLAYNSYRLFDTHKATFLIAVVDYTKWIECFILDNTNLGNIIVSLSECFSRFSPPSVNVSDN
ncbi:hypothetical protein PR048_033616 [Dryococelus australis]|uniref:Integrase n=1 Tax=Dryococelus australis TaxID=614101 RepID=A0ABQ9G0T8_9NEOP|nr:hypothetical protein PR048_033616 [Dryococelus australis]